MRLRRLRRANIKHSGPATTRKTTSPESDRPSGKAGQHGKCGYCGARAAIFDWVLDINICTECGAHETTVGWTKP